MNKALIKYQRHFTSKNVLIAQNEIAIIVINFENMHLKNQTEIQNNQTEKKYHKG